MAGTVLFAEPAKVANRAAHRNRFDALDLSNDFKMR
jgi:hypothetical protein